MSDQSEASGTIGPSPMFVVLLRILVFSFLGFAAVISWFIARQHQDLNIFTWTLLCVLTIWFGFQGWLQGAISAVLGWFRLAASIAAGYFFGTIAGSAAGLSGFAATVGGFYLCAIGVYVVIGLLGRLAIDPKRSPGMLDAAAGLFLGAAEGFVLFALVSWPLSLYQPVWNTSPVSLAGNVSQKVSGVVSPFVPAQASGVVELVALARDAKSGIDPEKVDQERLATLFAPVRSHPKVQALSNDAELRTLIQQKNAAALMKHPKVLDLLNDKDVQSLAAGIDLHEVASVLRAGLRAEPRKYEE
ncbi:MAG TPA: CvpA family protein [Candidatus Ozemobacteraceae bacterium]|nr:CvpA family protein [Candidatus Ozemobacteraceae bacterium]HQG27880.1 CvpA family protein [Candidatus Ozemobacteraceae bacterium]